MATNKKTTRRVPHFKRRVIRSNPTRIDLYPVIDAMNEGGKIKTFAQLRVQLRKVLDDDLLWELMEQAQVQDRKRRSLMDAMTKRIVTLNK